MRHFLQKALIFHFAALLPFFCVILNKLKYEPSASATAFKNHVSIIVEVACLSSFSLKLRQKHTSFLRTQIKCQKSLCQNMASRFQILKAAVKNKKIDFSDLRIIKDVR